MDYNITYRPKNKGWQYIISKKVDGKWKQVKSKQGFRIKNDAKIDAESSLETLKAQEVCVLLDPGTTFKKFADGYIEHRKLHLQANSIKIYNSALTHMEFLFDKKVEDIESLDIQKFIDDMARNKVAGSTAANYTQKIIKMLSYGMKHNIIKKFDLSILEKPKSQKVKEKKALTQSEIDKLLQSMKGSCYPQYYFMALIASNFGLRLGEILGLKWSDFDFKENILTVERQVKRLNDGVFGIGDVKSKNSNRKIPFSANTAKAVIEYNKKTVLNQHGFILSNYLHYDVLGQGINNELAHYGANATIHELRHSFATILILNGVDFKTVAMLMGHTVEQTMKTYSHITDDYLSNAKNLMKNIF